MKIGISLPVHERVDILINQIINIYRHITNPLICIHLSRNSSIIMEELRVTAELTGVILNEERFATQHGSGLMAVHISNFKLMKKLGGVDYLLFMSSNEMLIKSGLESHMSKYDLGIQVVTFEECPSWHLFNRGIEEIFEIKRFTELINVSAIKGGQAEGQFFKASLFDDLVKIYEQCFDKSFSKFETEEIIPSTFFSQDKYKSCRYALPITLQNYCLDFEINMELIEKLRKNDAIIKGAQFPGCLNSPHNNHDSGDSIYSVKRIDRTMNQLRMDITKLNKFDYI